MEVSALKSPMVMGRHGRSPLLRLQSDDHLISLTRSGHDSAFEVLLARYEARLLAFCRHLVGSREDAEDVLQDVFSAAYHAILADERPINVRPWLYRIARNRCLNHLRRTPAIGVDSMDVLFAANGESTADKVHRREEFRLLVGDIHRLPETQRTALILREMDALSYDQIAEAMETTVPSVKSLLVRARVSLAEAAEARLLSCSDVRTELGEVAEGLVKRSSPQVRRHLRGCELCTAFEKHLKQNNRALAALLPVGPFALWKGGLLVRLTGAGSHGAVATGSSTTGSVASGGAASSPGLVSAGIGALGTKAAAGIAVAVVATAVGVTAGTQLSGHHVHARSTAGRDTRFATIDRHTADTHAGRVSTSVAAHPSSRSNTAKPTSGHRLSGRPVKRSTIAGSSSQASPAAGSTSRSGSSATTNGTGNATGSVSDTADQLSASSAGVTSSQGSTVSSGDPTSNLSAAGQSLSSATSAVGSAAASTGSSTNTGGTGSSTGLASDNGDLNSTGDTPTSPAAPLSTAASSATGQASSVVGATTTSPSTTPPSL